jgi:hypothetical protein|tara:strand:+ start:85 stop:357 length:273 start_codon:yes stop_codon:yes gene_type:complete
MPKYPKKDLPLSEYVHRPRHYNQGGIETFDYVESNNFDFAQGNVIKYVSRFKFKDGIRDLHKARWYLDRLIERVENNEGAATESSPDGQP